MRLNQLEKYIERDHIIKDSLGQVINEGDTVLYAANNGDLKLDKITHIFVSADGNEQLYFLKYKTKLRGSQVIVVNKILEENQLTVDSTPSLQLNTNNSIYVFYCINIEEKTHGLIFFKPEMSGENGFRNGLFKLRDQYSGFIFIPRTYESKYVSLNINEFKLDSTFKSQAKKNNTLHFGDKLEYDSIWFQNGFNLSLTNMFKISHNESKYFPKEYLNKLLTFEFDRDINSNQLELYIDDVEFTNEIFSKKFTIYNLYNELCFYWEEIVPNLELFYDESIRLKNEGYASYSIDILILEYIKDIKKLKIFKKI